MTAQMKTYAFIPFDPILIIGFLKNSKLACDTNGVSEGAAMWLFHLFMIKTESDLLNAWHNAHGTNMKYCRSTYGIVRFFTPRPQGTNILPKNTQPMNHCRDRT